MRILHVTPYWEDAWAYGGIPRVVSSTTRALAARGHHVTVLTTDVRDALRRTETRHLVERIGEGSLAVVVLRNLSNRAAYQQLYLPIGARAWLADHAARFDVGHLHACRHLLDAHASRALARAGIPYLLQPHGTALRIERRFFVKRIWDAVVDRDTLPNAARLVAVSEAERRDLAALARAPTVVVENPIALPPPTTEHQRAAFRAAHGVGDRPLVLFLGKLTPRKRADLLVEAIARMGRPRPALVIAGNDMGARRTVERQARRLDVEATFIGLVEGDLRLAALAAADVVASPGHDEVFGLVPFEAIASHRPVVVADDHGCGALVRAVGGGLTFRTGYADALAAAIAAILGDRDGWRIRVAAAATEVRRRFSAERAAETLEALYREVVQGKQ
jgi:glycosyltransferase involved in cell wall biosynthesis